MPIYEYECSNCGCFEHSQSMHDAPLARCPKCRRKVQRLISASSFHLKGGGWYSDGYAKKAETKPTQAAGETKSTEPTSSEAKSETTAAEPKTPESKDSKSTSPPAASTKSKPKGSARSTADASSD